MSPLLTDPETIALAVELTDYGRNLSERHRYEGEPPFERLYEDHAVYLRALLGQDVEAAIAHFRAKLAPPTRPRRPGRRAAGPDPGRPALVRLGRLEEAIDVAAEHLAGFPESALICPGLPSSASAPAAPTAWPGSPATSGDLVNYAAAILQTGGMSQSAGRRPGLGLEIEEFPLFCPY